MKSKQRSPLVGLYLAISETVPEFSFINVSNGIHLELSSSMFKPILELSYVTITIIVQSSAISILQTLPPFSNINTSLAFKSTNSCVEIN